MHIAHPAYQCIHTRFEAQVAARPDAIALAYHDERLSYTELNRRANQLAHVLQNQNVGPEVMVGICAERSPELIVGLLGILKAGAAYVPLDPLFPRERLQFMLEDTGVTVLLTQEHLRHSLPATNATIVALDTDWPMIAQYAADNPTSAVTIEHTAYVTYTSGSTGKPKGSVIPHRSIPGFMDGVDYMPYDEHQIWLHYSSISWDALTLEVWPALLYGGQCVLYPAQLATPYDLGLAIQTYNINMLWLTVSLFNAIIDTTPDVLTGVQHLMVGGEALSVAHIARALELLPETRLVNGYGPSECTVVTCCYPLPRDLPANLASIPIGRPIGDRRVYLLDARLNRTPIGVPGELYVGGPAVARCYLNRPALTAEKMLPDPFSKTPGAVMYRSGDLARYRRDGLIEFVGRIDHQVKVRGFRIEPEEIEAVLNQHPAVQTGIVIAREDPTPTNDQPTKRLVAYVVPQPGHAPSIGELRSFLQPKLPDYMIPSAFVLLDALPLTANGKVNRQALPAPEQLRPDLEHEYIAPRTPLEELLAGIWADVLSLDRVGMFDNFFELGGQSLIAARLMARVREACRVEIPMRALFERPTVAGLAEYIGQAAQSSQRATMPPLVPVRRDQPLPLSFAQQRLWFLDQLEPNSPLYNVPTAVKLSGQLDTAALHNSLKRIAERHESLRTTFAADAGADTGQPRQIIAAIQNLPLAQVDLRERAPAERATEVAQLARAEARQPFDLARGPLLRATLLHLDELEHVLLLTMHHIIADGWSMGVLVREMAALYTAFAADTPEQAALPALPVQYADYALWQREWLHGTILEQQLDYWQQQLAKVPPVLKLNTDRPRPVLQTYRGGAHSFTLPSSLLHELIALSRREGTTLFMTTLAAFNVLLSWNSGQDDIVVGSPIAGRSRVELEPLIGFFINTLVLRSNLAEPTTFQDLLRQVRETTLGAYAHQDVPFERLVEALQPDRQAGHLPLFQVWFVLQNMPLPALELPGLTLHTLPIDHGIARYDLRLGLIEAQDELSGSLEYNSDVFDAATAVQLVRLFETILLLVTTRPQISLDELKATLNDTYAQYQLEQQQALKNAVLHKLKQSRRSSVRGS